LSRFDAVWSSVVPGRIDDVTSVETGRQPARSVPGVVEVIVRVTHVVRKPVEDHPKRSAELITRRSIKEIGAGKDIDRADPLQVAGVEIDSLS